MALTLSNVLVETLRRLGHLQVRKATGGTTTTIVDSTLIGRTSDNQWKEGTAFILHDAGGASAAPEGQFQRVSAYVDSTGTLTVDTAFTTAPASGDIYAIGGPLYPLNDLIASVNAALKKLGDLDLVDTTTLDTASAQTEYAAAVAWKRARPYRVDVQGRTGDADDNRWHTQVDFDWVPAAAGSTGLIVLSHQPTPSRDIRVWYRDKHPDLWAYSDVVHESLDPETVFLAAKSEAMQWRINHQHGGDPFTLQEASNVRQELENRKVDTPRWRIKRRPRLLLVGLNVDDDDDVPTPS